MGESIRLNARLNPLLHCCGRVIGIDTAISDKDILSGLNPLLHCCGRVIFVSNGWIDEDVTMS